MAVKRCDLGERFRASRAGCPIDTAIFAQHNPRRVKLLDQLEQVCRAKHYAPKTHEAYASWVRQFLSFHRGRWGAWGHPRELGESDVEAFLTHLAVERKLSESSQNQALNGIVFLYRHVLRRQLGSLDAVRAARPKRVPTVLSVLGHKQLETTMLYTHVTEKRGVGVRSPLDALAASTT